VKAINKIDWVPGANISLETNALNVATSDTNALVVAGPGAGKTELLAQRACYLLQTNTCKFPRKILAISFKKDAAYNLKQRVALRCDEELSRRFDSLTFDAFAKIILDRFKYGLPDELKMPGEYEITLTDQTILDFYKSEDQTLYNTTDRNKLLEFHVALSLPYLAKNKQDIIRYKVWQKMLTGKTPKLTFRMIMKLAELIIRCNPKIKKYLQQTYCYVFLDEFQDTTSIQYDLFKTCFLNSNSIFTAVGDDKQRIMLWAGAKNSVFGDFETDTGAMIVPLTMNFRSAPRLVELQNYLVKNLLGKSDFSIPSPKWENGEGECFIWFFKNPEEETRLLFETIQQLISNDGINPRDICILVKQQLAKYAGSLIEYFNKNGIKARDENILQSLLTEDASIFIINMLYLAFRGKSGGAKELAFSFLGNIHNEIEDTQLLKLELKLSNCIKQLQKAYSSTGLTNLQTDSLIDEIVNFAGKDRIRSAFSNYKNGAILNGIIKDFKSEFYISYGSAKNIPDALDALIGKDTIPVMTVHKSKGLEYHTVIFVGLEDGAFWSFQKQPDEDKCTFFVALSRAKERVIFTFSREREGRYGNTETQSFSNIQVIFKELEASGVAVIEEKV
jgi:DNA helicase II / ATP-dependent DNA helicase PcrA